MPAATAACVPPLDASNIAWQQIPGEVSCNALCHKSAWTQTQLPLPAHFDKLHLHVCSHRFNPLLGSRMSQVNFVVVVPLEGLLEVQHLCLSCQNRLADT